MATVFVFNLPAGSHIHPTLQIARELVRQGERVVFFATEEFRAPIEEHGAVFRLLPHPMGSDRFRILSTAVWQLEATAACMPDLVREAAIERPAYVLLDYACLWGRVFAEHTKLPTVVLHSTIIVPPPSRRTQWYRTTLQTLLQPSSWGRLARFVSLAGDVASKWQVTRLRIPLDLVYDQRLGHLRLVLAPPELQPDRERLGDAYQFVGVCMNSVPAPSLPSSKPLVYISLGTIWNDRADFYALCVRAFAEAPYDVVLSVGGYFNIASLGPLPANIAVHARVDQLEILRRASAFISHVGMNSACEALLAGVPLLVFPQAFDQFLIARRLCELGAARALPRTTLTAPAIRAATDELLRDSQLRARSQHLGETLRAQDGPRSASRTILAFRDRTRAARWLRIEGRARAPGSIWFVGPGDFQLREQESADARDVLREPNLSLYCLDIRRRRALFVDTRHVDPTDAPFLYQAQAEHAQRCLAVPFDLLHELAEDVNLEPRRLVPIFSTGRCGSTLVSNLFRVVPGARSYSEPDVFTQLVSMRLSGMSDTELRPLIRSCVRLQCAPMCAAPGNTVSVLKFRSFVVNIADLITEEFPTARTLFLYRSAEGYFQSAAGLYPEHVMRRFLKPQPRIQAAMQFLDPLVLAHANAERSAMTPAQVLVCLWASAMRAGARIEPSIHAYLAVRYEDLQATAPPVLKQILTFCGAPSPSQRQVDSVLQQDAQSGTALARKNLDTRWRDIAQRALPDMHRYLAKHAPELTANMRLPRTLQLPAG